MSKFHWNYRVMEFKSKHGLYRAIHSVHYEDGEATSYSEPPETVLWDADEGGDSVSNRNHADRT